MEKKVSAIEQKDALYYSDLIYHLKSLAGLEFDENEETEKRIWKRSEFKVVSVDLPVVTPFGTISQVNELSDFDLEVFELVSKIYKKAGVESRSLGGISKYPELVRETIQELEVQLSNLENKSASLSLKKKQ